MPAGTKRKPKVDKLAVALRIFVYVFLALAGMVIFPRLMIWAPNMYFVGSALSTFAAAAVANAVALRIYDRGQLADIGMGWTRGIAKKSADRRDRRLRFRIGGGPRPGGPAVGRHRARSGGGIQHRRRSFSFRSSWCSARSARRCCFADTRSRC